MVERIEDGIPVPTMKWVHVVGSLVTWVHFPCFDFNEKILALIIAEMEYRHGVKNGWVLVTFWVITSTMGGIRIQAYLNENDYV